ncbi:phage tail protein [Paenibacillus radicis (ex Gao et al. 2016)]|nr:tail fiber protein [Paenibacillus radicis (ex Gao et al. 2016)]
MSDQFLAEIRIFAGNFPPRGWAFCNGQLLAISQNTALFSLLGTTYGGDGRSTFGLPNLQGRAPMHPGQGPGLSMRDLGESGGQSNVTLLPNEMPAHSHSVKYADSLEPQSAPAGALPTATHGRRSGAIYGAGPATQSMHPMEVQVAGGGQPHNNMQPYLTLNFIIALQGIFPPRS